MDHRIKYKYKLISFPMDNIGEHRYDHGFDASF